MSLKNVDTKKTKIFWYAKKNYFKQFISARSGIFADCVKFLPLNFGLTKKPSGGSHPQWVNVIFEYLNYMQNFIQQDFQAIIEHNHILQPSYGKDTETINNAEKEAEGKLLFCTKI